MLASHPTLAKLRACVRPLLIDSGIPAAPLGIWGSCVLAAYKAQAFVVTAAHLVRRNHSGKIRVLASDKAVRRLPISQGVGVFADRQEDEVDLVVYPAALTGLSRRDIKGCRLVDLGLFGAADWESGASVSQFIVVGYPEVLSSVDYDQGRVTAGQVLLAGTYESPFFGAAHMHTLKIDNPLGLKEFSGFSGGAVFSIQPRVAADALCRFCGVAVQGTASSGLVHFVDWHCLMSLVTEAAVHTQRFGLRLPERGKKPNR